MDNYVTGYHHTFVQRILLISQELNVINLQRVVLSIGNNNHHKKDFVKLTIHGCHTSWPCDKKQICTKQSTVEE
jgi:hypothetical protein